MQIDDQIQAKPLYSISFSNGNSGWLVGEGGIIYRTIDKGQNWENIKESIVSHELTDVFFVDEQKGWVVGQNGVIANTVNGGTIWNLQTSNTLEKLNSVQFIDENIGWIAGNNGIVLKTINGGTIWDKISFPQKIDLNSNYFVSADTGWVVGENAYIYKTDDAGQTWQHQPGPHEYDYSDYYTIQFINSKIGWVAGGNWTYTRNIFAKTENGGETWQYISTKTDIIYDFNFFDDRYGWLVTCGGCGNDGSRIYHTENGGFSWQEQYFVNTYKGSFSAIGFFNQNSGLAVSSDGIILYTNDSGNTWNIEKSIAASSLSSICFVKQNSVWLVGDCGNILKGVKNNVQQMNETEQIARQFHLSQNYPNPFNPSTTILYHLPTSTHVTLTIYNLAGQQVETLVNGFQASGKHQTIWQAKGLSNGVYFID